MTRAHISFVLFLLIACDRNRAAGPSSPVVMRAGVREYEEAKRLKYLARRLDYRAPMADVRGQMELGAADNHVIACLAALPEACLALDYEIADNVAPLLHEAAIATAERCLAGSRTDCSTLQLRNRFASYVMNPGRREELYLDACTNGDKVACASVDAARACLREAHTTPSCIKLRAAAPSMQAVVTLGQHFCDAGIAIMCAHVAHDHQRAGREIPDEDAERYAMRGCVMESVVGCDVAIDLARDLGHEDRIPDLEERKRHALTVECDAGSWFTCGESRDPRFEELAVRACDDGELLACERSTSLRAKELECTSYGLECAEWLALSGTDPRTTRDILEHGCQRDNPADCVRLAKGYREHTYEEPVPGRADALQRYVCKTDKASCNDLPSSP